MQRYVADLNPGGTPYRHLPGPYVVYELNAAGERIGIVRDYARLSYAEKVARELTERDEAVEASGRAAMMQRVAGVRFL